MYLITWYHEGVRWLNKISVLFVEHRDWMLLIKPDSLMDL